MEIMCIQWKLLQETHCKAIVITMWVVLSYKNRHIQCYIAMWTMRALAWVCKVDMVAKINTHEHRAMRYGKITFNN